MVRWEVDLILQWSLGFGEASNPLLPPPDAMAGGILCVWAVVLKLNQRAIRRSVEEGNASARALILPYFGRVLTCVAICTLLFSCASVAETTLEDRVSDPPVLLLMALTLVRFVAFETMTEGFALMFLRPGFMREDTVSFSMRWSLVWSVPYSVVASILFWKYRNTHSSVPRIFQMAASTLILLTYFVVIVVLKKGRSSLRPYAFFTIVWRVVQVVGLALSFGNPSDVLAAVVDVAFMVVQGLGFPLAIHSVLYLDTMYWRNPWRASPKGIMTSLPPLASLCSALCCIRGRSGLRHNIASTFGRANSSGGDAVVGQKDALEPRLSDNRVADHTASTALLADSGRSSSRSYSTSEPTNYLSRHFHVRAGGEDLLSSMTPEQRRNVESTLLMWSDLKPSLNDAPIGEVMRVLDEVSAFLLDFAHVRVDRPIATSGLVAICRGTYRKRPVAIKMFTPLDADTMTTNHLVEAAQEARVLSRLHHPNIVEFMGMCITPPDVCLVFELCELGDLRRLLDNIVRTRQASHVEDPVNFSALEDSTLLDRPPGARSMEASDDEGSLASSLSDVGFFEPLQTMDVSDVVQAVLAEEQDPEGANRAGIPWRHRISMAIEVASAVAYLHGLTPPVLHRDIKSSNLLITASGTLKLCDFGTSKQYQPATVTTTSMRGTVAWIAPESMEEQHRHTTGSDVYSLAMVLWELLCYREPYPDFTNGRIVVAVSKRHHRLPCPPTAPRSYVSLVRQGWHGDPQRRPSASLILATLQRMQAALPHPVPPSISSRGASSKRRASSDSRTGLRLWHLTVMTTWATRQTRRTSPMSWRLGALWSASPLLW